MGNVIFLELVRSAIENQWVVENANYINDVWLNCLLKSRNLKYRIEIFIRVIFIRSIK
jgi:hypothetical protein